MACRAPRGLASPHSLLLSLLEPHCSSQGPEYTLLPSGVAFDPAVPSARNVPLPSFGLINSCSSLRSLPGCLREIVIEQVMALFHAFLDLPFFVLLISCLFI